jgi:HEPN domain-containing protein
MHFHTGDDFADASRRHLADARVLSASERWDGVLHVAGFAAECALKASLRSAQGAAFVGKDHGHDLEGLAGWAWAWTSAIVGDTGLRHALADVGGSALAHEHPSRRYWGRGWTREEAESALALAGRIVQEHVVAAVLDRGTAWGED